ncbi:MAG: hypothetical protein EBZ49_00480 [Proteobacteria bacterium]|nr:hypothetical protein [Pseudomonadota bacterium]
MFKIAKDATKEEIRETLQKHEDRETPEQEAQESKKEQKIEMKAGIHEKHAFFLNGFEKRAKEMTEKERSKLIWNVSADVGSLAGAGVGAYKAYGALPESVKAPIREGAAGYIRGVLLGSLAGALTAGLLTRNKKRKVKNEY